MMFQQQIKGLVAIAVILAAIPFFYFISPAPSEPRGPIFSDSGKNKIVVEITSVQGSLSGIYYIEKGSLLKDFLHGLDHKIEVKGNIPLQNAMTIELADLKDPKNVVVQKMSAGKRLALGLPLDINLATSDDLILIPGIGEAMAGKILSRRQAIGQYRNLEQLTAIDGIKERKLSKLSKYLCIE